MAEALYFVGGKAPCAWGRVKVRFWGGVFLTVCKSCTGGMRRGFGGDECGALGRDVVVGEGERVRDLPALKLGHKGCGIWEPSSRMVVEELIKSAAELVTVESCEVKEAS